MNRSRPRFRSRRSATAEERADAAALDAYLARHHVTTPPPMPRCPRVRSAGELALAEDARMGLVSW